MEVVLLLGLPVGAGWLWMMRGRKDVTTKGGVKVAGAGFLTLTRFWAWMCILFGVFALVLLILT